MKNESKKYLQELGLKELLLDKLNKLQLDHLASYAMDHAEQSNLTQNLIQLAAMESRGKTGAIELAEKGIASVSQLKNLSIEDIKLVSEIYELSRDEDLARKEVMQMIVLAQQEKIFSHSSGKKGEFYADPNELESNKSYGGW